MISMIKVTIQKQIKIITKWLQHSLLPIANQCFWQLTLQLQGSDGLMVSDIKTKAVESRHINHTGQKIMNRMPSVV